MLASFPCVFLLFLPPMIMKAISSKLMEHFFITSQVVIEEDAKKDEGLDFANFILITFLTSKVKKAKMKRVRAERGKWEGLDSANDQRNPNPNPNPNHARSLTC